MQTQGAGWQHLGQLRHSSVANAVHAAVSSCNVSQHCIIAASAAVLHTDRLNNNVDAAELADIRIICLTYSIH